MYIYEIFANPVNYEYTCYYYHMCGVVRGVV